MYGYREKINQKGGGDNIRITIKTREPCLVVIGTKMKINRASIEDKQVFEFKSESENSHEQQLEPLKEYNLTIHIGCRKKCVFQNPENSKIYLGSQMTFIPTFDKDLGTYILIESFCFDNVGRIITFSDIHQDLGALINILYNCASYHTKSWIQ